MAGRVLIVEDEAPLREALAAYLRREGIQVDEASDGETGWRSFRDARPDLVVLDRKLPGLGGEDLCRRIKGLSSVPVIMATSLILEEAALEAFALGADDYVRKPYSVRELAARIQARLRVQGSRRSPEADVPAPWTEPVTGLVLSPEARTASWGGTSVPLTPHEYALALLLLSHPGQVFSRQILLDRVWEDPSEVSDRTVDAHVKNLRAKLKDLLGDEPPLVTVYGRGYRWAP